MPTQRGAFYKGVFQSGHCKKIIFPCFRETLKTLFVTLTMGKAVGKNWDFQRFMCSECAQNGIKWFYWRWLSSFSRRFYNHFYFFYICCLIPQKCLSNFAHFNEFSVAASNNPAGFWHNVKCEINEELGGFLAPAKRLRWKKEIFATSIHPVLMELDEKNVLSKSMWISFQFKS